MKDPIWLRKGHYVDRWVDHIFLFELNIEVFKNYEMCGRCSYNPGPWYTRLEHFGFLVTRDSLNFCMKNIKVIINEALKHFPVFICVFVCLCIQIRMHWQVYMPWHKGGDQRTTQWELVLYTTCIPGIECSCWTWTGLLHCLAGIVTFSKS